jgi:hypothetical protein
MALVGSGLQAWIQTLWFLSRVEAKSVVVLDEPDVYLHADLQKKLIKVLAAEGYTQTIVATHSLELISDVSPNEIVSITKRAGRSRSLSSSAQAQSVADSLGTNLNIQLSKVANAGKIIFVEGKDHAFLDQVAFKFGSNFYDKFTRLPHFSVGGLNNWRRAATTSEAFYQTSSGKVCSEIILDRDYKPEATRCDITNEAAKSHLQVKFWSKKEIENYFWNLDLITSYIVSRAAVPVDADEVAETFNVINAELKAGITVLMADSLQAADRKIALTTAMARAQRELQELVSSGTDISDLIGGKEAITRMSGQSQSKWNVQVSPMALCRHMSYETVPVELREVVQDLVERRCYLLRRRSFACYQLPLAKFGKAIVIVSLSTRSLRLSRRTSPGVDMPLW